MKICMVRVDDRLVHGQITTVWARHLRISTIFVVDDALSNDSLAINVLRMATPPTIVVHIYSVAQMAAALKSEAVSSAQIKAMLLFRDLEAAEALFAHTGKLFETLSLGGMPSRIGRYELGKNLFFAKEERNIALNLINRYGISIISQMLPSDVPIDVGAILRENDGK